MNANYQCGCEPLVPVSSVLRHVIVARGLSPIEIGGTSKDSSDPIVSPGTTHADTCKEGCGIESQLGRLSSL